MVVVPAVVVRKDVRDLNCFETPQTQHVWYVSWLPQEIPAISLRNKHTHLCLLPCRSPLVCKSLYSNFGNMMLFLGGKNNQLRVYNPPGITLFLSQKCCLFYIGFTFFSSLNVQNSRPVMVATTKRAYFTWHPHRASACVKLKFTQVSFCWTRTITKPA